MGAVRMIIQLQLKCLNVGFDSYKHSLQKMLIDGLEWCGLLVDYCDVFISCLDSHSDGTHSLQMIHWWTSDVMLHFSKSVPVKKQTHLHLNWPEWIFISGWIIPNIWPWTTKPVLSRWGIFVAIAKNTLYGSKLLIFLLCQKSSGH